MAWLPLGQLQGLVQSAGVATNFQNGGSRLQFLDLCMPYASRIATSMPRAQHGRVAKINLRKPSVESDSRQFGQLDGMWSSDFLYQDSLFCFGSCGICLAVRYVCCAAQPMSAEAIKWGPSANSSLVRPQSGSEKGQEQTRKKEPNRQGETEKSGSRRERRGRRAGVREGG
eukprot:362607-Chlamydomonas_euryale.AAC.20